MTLLEEIVQANHNYQATKDGIVPKLSAKPTRHILVITCIDCRLIDLLEPAMGIARGEANILKTAGNYISPGMNDTVKSVLVSIFELGVTEIIIMGHLNCGVAGASKDGILSKMLNAHLDAKDIETYKNDVGNWLDHYKDPESNVIESVTNLRSNPLIPKNIPIHGMIIDPDHGHIKVLVNGY